METIWYALLGLFFAAYLVLGGYDYAVGLVSTVDPSASLTVAGAAAGAAAGAPTLRLLSWLAALLLPALLGFQLMCWWVFRGRIDGRTPVYW